MAIIILTQRVKVLHVTHGDAIVVHITDHLILHLLPATKVLQEAMTDQQINHILVGSQRLWTIPCASCFLT